MTAPDRLRGGRDAAGVAHAESSRLGEFGCVVAGRIARTSHLVEVRSPFDNALIAVVHRAGPSQIEDAVAAAAAAFQTTRKLPSWKRADVLEKVGSAIASRAEDLARIIALEAGKPIRTARVEVSRAAFVFKVAAEESKRMYGELVPLDWLPGHEQREAIVRRVPLGPVAGITPFNFPLNLVSHKVAPALAAGNPIIIRPASQTPISSLTLAQIVIEAGWPPDAISVVPSSTPDARPLVEDERIKLLTFTGSPAVGWDLKRRAGRKRVALELGGNAAVIVHGDADVEYAAERVAWGGFAYAGQSCISVQRVYVQDAVYDRFSQLLVGRVNALVTGDPLDERTDVGPLIDATAAERVDAWIADAKAAGARVLTGGTRRGNLWQPTVLDNLRPDLDVSCQEVFAPVVGLFRYRDAAEAIAAANDSAFGLQAGLFTHDERVIAAAVDGIDVGGLMVNDVSSFRIDHMPYGGVKLSGFGREGLRYAIEEMTEVKLVTFNRKS